MRATGNRSSPVEAMRGSTSYEARAMSPENDSHLSASKSGFFGIVFFLFSFGLPMLLLGPPADPSLAATGLWAVNAILLLASALRLSAILGNGEPRIFHAVYWFFIYVAMAVVPMAQLHTGTWGLIVDHSYLVTAQLICLVASLSLETGYTTRVNLGPPKTRSHQGRLVTIGRLRALSMLGLALSALYVASLGSLQVFFQSRRELGEAFEGAGLRDDSQVGSALLMTAGTIPVLVAAILWGIRLGVSRPERRRVEPWLWLVVLLSANLVVNNPISNARFWILTILIGVLFSLPRVSSGLFRAAITTGIIAALVVFPYTDYFRVASEFRESISLGPVAETIATKDYDQSPMTANGVWWVANFGHTLGRQTFGALLFFYPRSAWPDKPRDTGVEIGTAIGSPNVNLSSPLWLEVWADYSWVGIVVAFVLLGILLRRGDDWFLRARNAQGGEIWLAQFMLPLLAGYSLIIMRGPLLQSMSRLAVLIMVCVLVTAPVRSQALSRINPIRRAKRSNQTRTS
jgi:hypothetical protein